MAHAMDAAASSQPIILPSHPVAPRAGALQFLASPCPPLGPWAPAGWLAAGVLSWLPLLLLPCCCYCCMCSVPPTGPGPGPVPSKNGRRALAGRALVHASRLGTHDGSLTSLSSLKFHLPLSTLGAFFGAQAPDNPHPLYRARPSLPHSLLGMLPLLQMSGPGACRNLHCPAALHIADHAPCFSRQHTVCCDCPFPPLSSLLFPSLNLLHPRRCVALT
ncbi:hypothetical protein BDY17DRAFT_71357 [Neohortaea acidophila]|uniref:Uncharacterized protein n=1 Tax=Neohortaea acidophila TaxID=245834 RepID=A0A6A6Q2E8_9PEZI|nr:uncharacterized protein BDY17DRAFT_71357 [Neohortaea acidophila]KAF2486126.1 hypothetical protein BDY17DRAFT_71357 [Neohortaea acidophila]